MYYKLNTHTHTLAKILQVIKQSNCLHKSVVVEEIEKQEVYKV